MELGYVLWGKKNDPTNKIVLLHGMGGTGALWRPVAATLENYFRVLAPDQRGHGKSRGPQESYSPVDYGTDVIEIVRKLDFHPTWILGHSMGVRTAVAAAKLKPEWFKGMILVDLGFSGAAGGGLGDDLAHFLKILPGHFASRDEARKFMAANCPDPSIAQYLMAVSASTPNGAIQFPFDHEALIATIEAAKDSSIRSWIEELARNQMPILVLRGEKSLVWSREEFENEKKALSRFPSITFKEIAETGHGLPFEKRQIFLDEIFKFTKIAKSV